MSGEHIDPAGKRGQRRRRVVRIGVLLGNPRRRLLVYVSVPGRPPRRPRAPASAGRGHRKSASVAPGQLSPLREDVARVVPERLARLYEEGTVVAAQRVDR